VGRRPVSLPFLDARLWWAGVPFWGFSMLKLSVILLVGCALVVGCGQPSTELTAQEQANFAGGPRPASANEAMKKSIEEYKKKHPGAKTP